MDKFGIFKLLNSFLSFYGQKSAPQQNSPEPEKNDGNNILNTLLKSLNGNANAKVEPQNNASLPSSAKPPSPATLHTQSPLQADMLKTMVSHEEFIRRVKEKNPQTHY